MTILLTITVLVLISISIWQITKIFELSQPKKVNTQVADDNDNQWNGQLMFAFLIFIYGITLLLLLCTRNFDFELNTLVTKLQV